MSDETGPQPGPPEDSDAVTPQSPAAVPTERDTESDAVSDDLSDSDTSDASSLQEGAEVVTMQELDVDRVADIVKAITCPPHTIGYTECNNPEEVISWHRAIEAIGQSEPEFTRWKVHLLSPVWPRMVHLGGWCHLFSGETPDVEHSWLAYKSMVVKQTVEAFASLISIHMNMLPTEPPKWFQKSIRLAGLHTVRPEGLEGGREVRPTVVLFDVRCLEHSALRLNRAQCNGIIEAFGLLDRFAFALVANSDWTLLNGDLIGDLQHSANLFGRKVRTLDTFDKDAVQRAANDCCEGSAGPGSIIVVRPLKVEARLACEWGFSGIVCTHSFVCSPSSSKDTIQTLPPVSTPTEVLTAIRAVCDRI